MKSKELRWKIKIILDNTLEGMGHEPDIDSILSLLETAIIEAEPKQYTDKSYPVIQEYKSNLLALVRGEK